MFIGIGISIPACAALSPTQKLINDALAILRRPGLESHVYMPGVGWVNGLVLSNFIMEDGTQPLTVDQPWGYAGDAAGDTPVINATQATTANKPILRRGAVNRCLQSENFASGTWAVTAAVKTSTTSTDPNGGSTALLLTSDATTNQHIIIGPNSSSFQAGVTYTQSVYLKAGAVSRAQVTFSSGGFGASQYANFSLVGAGSVLASTGGTPSIVSVGNGWYRCSFTAVATTTALVASVVVAFINSDTATRAPSYAGNAADNLLVAFAQLETGSTASPYVPTTTAAASSSVGPYWAEFDGTDFLSLAAVPFQQADDHLVIAAVEVQSIATTRRVFSIASTSSTTPRLCDLRVDAATGFVAANWADDAAATVTITDNINRLGQRVIASARKSGNVRTLRVNAAQVGTNTTALGTTTVNNGGIGALFINIPNTQMLGGIFSALVVRDVGAVLTAADVSILERWLAQGAQLTL